MVDAVLSDVDLTDLSGSWRERVVSGVQRVLAAAMTATGLFLTGLAQAISGSDGLDPLAGLQQLDPTGFPITLAALGLAGTVCGATTSC